MAKREKYEVWFAVKNYKGELYDKEVIAVFFSKIRATDYVKYCERDNKGLFTGRELFVFGIDEK